MAAISFSPGAILSILANPLFFMALDRSRSLLERLGRHDLAERAAKEEEQAVAPTRLTDHAIVVGYGRVGSLVGRRLLRAGKPVLVIEDTNDLAAKLQDQGIETIVGNAARPAILAAANPAGARWLFLAIPNGFEAGQVVEQARQANPHLDIVARAHSDAEVDYLRKHGANYIIMGEREIARGMIEHALGEGAADEDPAAQPA